MSQPTPGWYVPLVTDQPRALATALRVDGHDPAARFLGSTAAEWAVRLGSPGCLARLARAPGGWGSTATQLLDVLSRAIPQAHGPDREDHPHTSTAVFRMLLAAGGDVRERTIGDETLADRLFNDATTHWVPVLKDSGVLPQISWGRLASRGQHRALHALIEAFSPPIETLSAVIPGLLVSANAIARGATLDVLIAAGARWPADRDRADLYFDRLTELGKATVLSKLPALNFPDAPSRNHWLRQLANEPDEVWAAWTRDRRWDPDQEGLSPDGWVPGVTPLALRRLVGVGFDPARAWKGPLDEEPRSLWERPGLMLPHWDVLSDPALKLTWPFSPETPGRLRDALILALRRSAEDLSLAERMHARMGPTYQPLWGEALDRVFEGLLNPSAPPLTASRLQALATWVEAHAPEFWARSSERETDPWVRRLWPLVGVCPEAQIWDGPAWAQAARENVQRHGPWLPTLLANPGVQGQSRPAHGTWLKVVGRWDHPKGALEPLPKAASFWRDLELNELRADLRARHALEETPQGDRPRRRQRP